MDAKDLPITPVDANSPVPLYHQIEIDLRHLIKSRVLKTDDLLPSEQALCEVYGVGRHTMRMALARLVSDNLIARKAGRGTFITQPETNRFYLDRSYTRQLQEMGMTPSARVLHAGKSVISADAPRPLHTKKGAPCFHLLRLRFANGEPIGLQDATILTELCPDIDQHDYTKESLYDVLSSHYDLSITQISHMVNAIIADEERAKLLSVAIGDPLLVVKTTAYVGDNQIIEHTTSIYRADRYEFSTTHIYE